MRENMTTFKQTILGKKLTLGLSVAALAIGGIAYAHGVDGADDHHAMMDADGNGVITRAEAQKAATEMFARMDVNKDGKLDQADREAAHAAMREKHFAALDTNGDGAISKAEFMADKGPGGPGMGDHDMGAPGGPGMDEDGAGKDGPGKHGGHDGMGGHHGMGGHGGMGGGMMMMAKMADTNNDGAISQAEFMAAATKHFDMADTNHDGQITKAEREAAHAAMKAQMKAKWQADKTDNTGQK